MTQSSEQCSPKPDAIAAHYSSGYEGDRLHQGAGQLDRERSRELLGRFLPPAPAAVLDIGGGPGGHACWLAARGYMVHLIDITPLHVEMARHASTRQPASPLTSAELGDARALSWEAETVDAVVLFGPLYHLTDRADRVQALREARRVLRPGGILLAVAISRFIHLNQIRLAKNYTKNFIQKVNIRICNVSNHLVLSKPEMRSGRPTWKVSSKKWKG